MLAEIGIFALFAAFVVATLGSLLALVGAWQANPRFVQSARNAFFVTLPLIGLTAGILIDAQLRGEYYMEYVHNVSKDAQPTTLKITALWGSQAGSLILWAFLLSLFIVATLLLNWKSERALIPWMMVISGVTLAFFLGLSNFFENPFERFWSMPDGSIDTHLFQPDGAKLAYPYQSEIEGEFFHTEPDAFFSSVPDARYDGRGLNPLLRHPGMIIHPPMLYLGFTGFIIPFAFAMAALITGSLGVGWIKATRLWSLVAWLFLSLGLILGGRWAYDVLGWGGYWGWDPVENSSFLPWLTGTAFLHSVMIQEKRGMLKGWNMVMIMLTYLLVLFGTVATRTGLLSSVHSFAQSPLSIPMAGFLSFTVLVCVVLFIWRGAQGLFENDHKLESLFSRESLFLFNNWVFLALTAVVFWGTWAELFTGLLEDVGLLGYTLNLGPEYYERITPWLFGALFILMGVAPLAAWRTASAQRLGNAIRIPAGLTAILMVGVLILSSSDATSRILLALGIGVVAFAGLATLMELYKGVAARYRTHGENPILAFINLFARNNRRYGGYTIHIGVVVIGIGIIGSTVFQEVRQTTLSPGEFMEIGPYELRYDEAFEARAADDRSMFIVNVSLFRDGDYITRLRPRRDVFGGASSPMTIAGNHSTLENDVYVLITFWEGDRVTLRVYRNPLVNFVWGGGLLLILGTLIAVLPLSGAVVVDRRQTASMMPNPLAAGD
jgi:cytochrome c-type biogenesis protein CcmF